MTPHEKAMADWKAENPRRKGTATHYANGKPKVEGKTQAQVKAEKKAYKPVLMNYKTDTSGTTPKKSRYGWAGKVGEAHSRNQKASHDKGYREDYR